MHPLSVLLSAAPHTGSSSNTTAYVIAGVIVLLAMLLSMDLSWSNITSDNRNDMVFGQKNRSYGAFEIRRNHFKQILIALGASIAFMSLALSSPKIIALMSDQKSQREIDDARKSQLVAEMQNIENPPVAPPPPPPPPPVEPPRQEMIAFVPPQAEDDEQEEPPVIVDPGQNVGNHNQDGDDEIDQLPPTPPTPPVITGETIYDPAEVQEQAEFPGGERGLREFLVKNVKYPDLERESGTQGRVYIEFVVGADGMVRNAKIKRSVSSGLDIESIRVVKMMPKWTPARQNGNAVPQKYILPVNFKIAN